MSETNLSAALRRLNGAPSLLVGSVISVGAGSAVVQLPDGTHVQARGGASVGAWVFVQGGVIQGDAPSLPLVTGTI